MLSLRQEPPLSKEVQFSTILERDEIETKITHILMNFDETLTNTNCKKGIYIYGSPGCGKTFFVKNLLKKLNYDIIHYDAGDVRNKSLIETITSDNISNQNVLNMMKQQPKKIVIVMDEIDGMNSGDKGSITSLIKLIRQKKTKKQKVESKTTNPIICIGNYYVDKKIKELMKVCHVFEMKKPTNDQMKKILSFSFHQETYAFPNPSLNLHNRESMFSLTPRIESLLVDYIQGDFRKLEFIMKIYHKNSSLIYDGEIQKIFQLKSYNDDAKKITQKLIETAIPLKQHNVAMNETDRTIIALLWHENIIDAITEKKLPYSITFPLYLTILDNICFSDYIDRITFQSQIWQFNEMSSMIKTFHSNKIYHNFLRKHSLSSHYINEIRFTKVLTKYSTEYNNILFIYNLCNNLDMDKKDLVSFFQELRLHYGKKIKECDLFSQIERIINHPCIDKLDIKRMFRYLDKNVKKDVVKIRDEDEYDEDDDDDEFM